MQLQFKLKLIPEHEISAILPLIYNLNEGRIQEDVLKKRLHKMLATGYKCLGAYDQEKLIGICGIWVLIKFYVGTHIEPDNVFVEEEYRSKGVGKLMIDWVLKHAEEIGCEASEVNVYINNEKGHQFWEAQGYKKVGFHMQQFFDKE